jgi:hypothetical protein
MPGPARQQPVDDVERWRGTPIAGQPTWQTVAPPAPAVATPPERGARARFRDWRHRRPFWAAILIILGGTEISLSGLAPMRVVLHMNLQGLAGQAVPIVMVICGLLLMFSPDQRMFYSVVAAGLAVASWITSNLGGFLVGLLLGVIGGSLGFAWSPVKASRKNPAGSAHP